MNFIRSLFYSPIENISLSKGIPSEMMRGEGPKVDLRFLIPFKTAGVVIGKGGENINKLREEYKVKITISDSCAPERVLTLDGDMGSAMEILDSILTRQVASNGEDVVDLRLLVHQSQVGCVIGRSGYKIKELREQSNLRTLKVYQMLCPSSTDRVIQLIGEIDKLLLCIRTIAELLEGAPPKGSRKNYDPLDADETISAEYGGWILPGQSLGLGSIGRRNISGAYAQIFNPDQTNNVLTSNLFSGAGVGSSRTNGNLTNSLVSGNGLMHQLNSNSQHHQQSQQNQLANSLVGNALANSLVGNTARLAHGSGQQQNSTAAAVAAAAVNHVLAHFGGSAGSASSGIGSTTGSLGSVPGVSNGTASASSLPHASAAAMLAATGGQTAGGPNATAATRQNEDTASHHQASAAAMVTAGMMCGHGIHGQQIVTQVTVTNKLIGAIMGKGGCRISQVRQESGADIKISKQEPNVEDRIITIAGTPEQVQNAQFLMQVCVKRYGDQYGT